MPPKIAGYCLIKVLHFPLLWCNGNLIYRQYFAYVVWFWFHAAYAIINVWLCTYMLFKFTNYCGDIALLAEKISIPFYKYWLNIRFFWIFFTARWLEFPSFQFLLFIELCMRASMWVMIFINHAWTCLSLYIIVLQF